MEMMTFNYEQHEEKCYNKISGTNHVPFGQVCA